MTKFFTKLKLAIHKIRSIRLINLCISQEYQNKVIHQVVTKQKYLWQFPFCTGHEDIIRAVIAEDGTTLQHASERLQNNKDLILSALSSRINKGQLFYYLNDFLKDDFEIAYTAIQYDSRCYEICSKRLQQNEQIALLAIKHDANNWTLRDISEIFNDNKTIVLELIKLSGFWFGASDRLKDDKDVALAAVKCDAQYISEITDRLRDDIDIVLAAVTNDGRAIQYASERLKNEETVVMAALHETARAFRYIGKKFQEEYVLALHMICMHVYNFRYIGEELKKDVNFILDLIFKLGDHVEFIEELVISKSVVMQFTLAQNKNIQNEDWPLIKQALITEPDLFLNPPLSIQKLFQTCDTKFVMYAQYALNKEWAHTIITEELPENVFAGLNI